MGDKEEGVEEDGSLVGLVEGDVTENDCSQDEEDGPDESEHQLIVVKRYLFLQLILTKAPFVQIFVIIL